MVTLQREIKKQSWVLILIAGPNFTAKAPPYPRPWPCQHPRSSVNRRRKKKEDGNLQGSRLDSLKLEEFFVNVAATSPIGRHKQFEARYRSPHFKFWAQKAHHKPPKRALHKMYLKLESLNKEGNLVLTKMTKR